MDTGTKKSSADSPLWPWLLVCAVAATWMSLGTLHRDHTADSLIPVLVSLQKWTPFFWEQDRFGMLVPLLVKPIHSPLASLIAQGAITCFAGLLSHCLLARYLLRSRMASWVAGVSLLFQFLIAPKAHRFDFWVNCSYGVWLTLGLAGLQLCGPVEGTRGRRIRWVCALACIVLCHWVYVAAALFFIPLIIFRRLLQAGLRSWFARSELKNIFDSESRTALVLMGGGLLAGVLFPHLVDAPHTNMATLAIDAWPECLGNLLFNCWTFISTDYWDWLLYLLAGASFVQLCCRSVRYACRAIWPQVGALFATAVCLTGFMATREWVALNGGCARYLYPAVFLIHMAVFLMVGGTIWALVGQHLRAAAAWVGIPALLVAVPCSYGWPAVAQVRHDITRLHGYNFGEFLYQESCSHMAGNYWHVWPAVYVANLLHYERGNGRRVWGVSDRSYPTSLKWNQTPLRDTRVAIFADDWEGPYQLKVRGFIPLTVTERRPPFLILQPSAGSESTVVMNASKP